MIPAWSYEGIQKSLTDAFRYRYESREGSRIRMVGILFAPPDSALAKSEIIPSLDYFHHRSGNNIDFFCAGYRRYGFGKQPDERKVTDDESPWYYSILGFEGLRQDIQRRSRWRYSGETDLVLLNATFDERCGKSDLAWSTAISCDLDKLVRDKAITSVRRYFETIFQFAESSGGIDPARTFIEAQGARIAGSAMKRVLAVLCNPRQTEPLRLQEEERAIRQAIQLSSHQNSISLRTLPASTVDDFSRALLSEEFNVVHFSGHGTRDGVVFEDEQGKPFQPPSAALARILGDYSPPIRCVVLNACLTSDDSKLISKRVPAVVGMDAPISDVGAIEFSRGFYDALGAGKDETTAYEEGVRRMHLKNLEHDVPQLFKGGRRTKR